MFEVVLVAARGATATRVVRTCHSAGAHVVAVHSDDDGQALHVELADEAVPLGGRGYEQSYGDARKLVEAARRSGADAVHPGAGRLAADAAVARAVEDAGLTWLGLPPRDPADVERAARAVGLAARERPVRRLLTTTVLGDRAVTREVQLAGDRPLLETAPAAGAEAAGPAVRALADALRLGPLAAAGLAVGDDGALRLVGLAPVCGAGAAAASAVLGTDLVAAQLRLAGGSRVRAGRASGAALALCVRALDGYAGRVRRWRLPDVDGVAVDAAVGEGRQVTAHSDRLLAVLTAVGDDEASAAARAGQALAELAADGVPTTLPLLREHVVELAPSRRDRSA